MDFSEELWWQNLQEWILDESKIVTYKNLACNLDVHVNMAKKMLLTFHQGQEDKVSAFYLISGQTKDGFKIQITAAKDLKKVENTFKKVLSKHIFALCQAKMDVTAADVLNCLTENCSPNQMICLRGIKSLAIKVKKEHEKVEEPPKQVETKKSEVKKQETVKTQKEEKPTIKSEVKKEKATETSSTKSKSSQGDKIKGKNSGGGIAAMFANAPPKKPPAVKKPEIIEKPPSVVEEPKVESSSQSKVNSKKRDQSSSLKNKKHKRIRMMSSSEESSDEDEKEEEERYNQIKPESPEKEPHEDKENDEEIVPDTPNEPKSRKRRARKLVNKTFVDESGFMVTKKEFVSCSESEEEQQPEPKKPLEKKEVVEKKSKVASENSKGSQPRKQASIMNFFSKK